MWIRTKLDHATTEYKVKHCVGFEISSRGIRKLLSECRNCLFLSESLYYQKLRDKEDLNNIITNGEYDLEAELYRVRRKKPE